METLYEYGTHVSIDPKEARFYWEFALQFDRAFISLCSQNSIKIDDTLSGVIVDALYSKRVNGRLNIHRMSEGYTPIDQEFPNFYLVEINGRHKIVLPSNGVQPLKPDYPMRRRRK